MPTTALKTAREIGSVTVAADLLFFCALKKSLSQDMRYSMQFNEMYGGAMCCGVNTAPAGAHDGSKDRLGRSLFSSTARL